MPAYLGTVLAGHAWLPADPGRAAVALLVLGPLVWGAVLAQNDLNDLPSDRENPRKANAPLVTGALPAARLRVWYRGMALAAAGVALLVGPLFMLGVGGVLLLGWAYSVPPLRLKTRPGWDVAVNALVVGLVSPAAGWSITRAPWDFPWWFGLIGVLFAAALYLPTTVTDLTADSRVGDTTFAVRFGARFAYRLGILLWTAALVCPMLCAADGELLPRSTLIPQLMTAPFLIAGYAVLTREPTIPKLAVVSMLFGIPTVGFMLSHVG
ncbi:hypothetical protein Acy02nite_82500 [Actinoplanes cyaneus]|uniref:Chlorophyll synthase n=1 Tax=Actinoplanes cyaneus TaxID=52696 RepID=A0A919MC72_9ACTN|nr:hypothetical protein Acy02nite_82500 [Actinoplanes cyaneus]